MLRDSRIGLLRVLALDGAALGEFGLTAISSKKKKSLLTIRIPNIILFPSLAHNRRRRRVFYFMFRNS